MTSATEIDSQDLIKKLAERLKTSEEIKPPEWASFAKTGVHKERPPAQKDWWWTRSASLLRKAYLDSQIGVSRLRKDYGGRKNRGHKPEHKFRASGSAIRKPLQQLEAAGFLKKEKGKGRVITSKGQSLVSSVANGLK